MCYRHGAEEARRFTLWAHNHEDTGSKPPGGIHFISSALQKLAVNRYATSKLAFNRHGAGAARVAHNHEDTGSKPVAGIHFTSHRCIKALEHYISNRHGAEVARRFTLWAHNSEVIRSKRIAGIHFTSHRCIKALEHYISNRRGAGVARGAHNSEVIRSKRIAGIYHTSHRCIKALEQLRNPLSSAAERRTHNLEVGRIKTPRRYPFHFASVHQGTGATTNPP